MTAQAAAGPWRALIPIFAACAAIGLQAGAAMPLVPLALEREGHDKFVIGIVSAAWAIGMLTFGTRIPAIASRFGAVPAIIGAVVVGSLITAAYTVTSGPVAWFILSFLHGVVGGVPWVVTEIWMNVVVEDKHRGRVMGVYSMMVALGLAMGPLVLQVVGVRGPMPFLACSALALLVAVPLLPYWKRAPPIDHPENSGFRTVILLAPLAMFAGFACGLGEQNAFSFLPVYAVGAGVSEETGALWLSLFVICNVVLQWPIGWMADHFDRRAVLAGCTAVSASLVIGLPLLPATSPAVLAVLMLWGGVSFAIYPVGLALLGQRLTGGDIARGNTAFSLLYILGGLVGRPVTGGAMDLFGEIGFGWTNAVFYIACCAWALLALRRPARYARGR